MWFDVVDQAAHVFEFQKENMVKHTKKVKVSQKLYLTIMPKQDQIGWKYTSSTMIIT